MELLDKIHEFLLTQGYTQKQIDYMDTTSVYIAMEIAIYAHRNQTRENGSSYVSHPYSVMDKYRDFVGIVENDYFCVNIDVLVGQCNIPYDGVQEVCLLHDVLEDTPITIEDIESIYTFLGLERYFKLYIKNPLILITHDKDEDYLVYINGLLINPTASLVKFMDLSDNLNPSTLNELNELEYDRLKRYVDYVKIINDKWNFLENRKKYFILKNKR